VRKTTYFDSDRRDAWPAPDELRPYFFALPGQQWFDTDGNDSASLTAEGVGGTEHLPPGGGRVDVRLMLWGDPKLGVLLIYSKRGGGHQDVYSSKGDLSRLGEHTRTLHDDPMPIGLYVPFDKAFAAVKEFIETDGELPKSIEWIANRDLPPNTFPPP
jgi:hypothetical protein